MGSRRRCCVLFPPAREAEPPRRRDVSAHSGDTPRQGHLLVGRISTWSSGDLAGGAEPRAVEILAEAMNACLGTRGDGSDASLCELDSAPAPAPAPRAAPQLPAAQAAPDPAVLAEELRKEGVRLVKAGQPAAAELVYTEALKHAPRAPMLYLNRAACCARLGRHGDALGDARACVALAPQLARGHWQEALALEAQGRYEEALKAHERACACAEGAEQLREYEARREQLRRTTASHADAAARVAKVLQEAQAGKASRGVFRAAKAAQVDSARAQSSARLVALREGDR